VVLFILQPPRPHHGSLTPWLPPPSCNSLTLPQAGGLATTGTQRILDVQPKSIHQRLPVFLGSKDDVEDLIKCYDAAKQ
jgi:hypothetical protein